SLPCVVLVRFSTLLSSTPFPYTTLFRSERFPAQSEVMIDVRCPGDLPRTVDICVGLADVSFAEAHVELHRNLPHGSLEIGTDFLDRKSTRLNSSHQINSYAVFCLKKKTNQHVDTATKPITPNYPLNPNKKQLHSLALIDRLVQRARRHTLKVLLERHDTTPDIRPA